jgi:asparagine synthase (glutamine-hydrolysing)
VWSAPEAALGCRRLAIVDVEHGSQPTCNEDGTIHVVFNGEIYNHRQLREKLTASGHRFRSNSDVEVLPHLYEEHGLDFVHSLDGVFGIALWDAKRRRLVLARDKVGVKPLFFHATRSRLVFASEIKGIFASGHCGIAVDPRS